MFYTEANNNNSHTSIEIVQKKCHFVCVVIVFVQINIPRLLSLSFSRQLRPARGAQPNWWQNIPCSIKTGKFLLVGGSSLSLFQLLRSRLRRVWWRRRKLPPVTESPAPRSALSVVTPLYTPLTHPPAGAGT